MNSCKWVGLIAEAYSFVGIGGCGDCVFARKLPLCSPILGIYLLFQYYDYFRALYESHAHGDGTMFRMYCSIGGPYKEKDSKDWEMCHSSSLYYISRLSPPVLWPLPLNALELFVGASYKLS